MEKHAIPLLDQQQPQETATATFSMGCFWSPDAIFGSQQGVVRTRVGYAGGSSENPDYRHMGDHMETLQLDYDPVLISYKALLDLFFEKHNPFRAPWKRQYASALFYHNGAQLSLIEQKIKELEEEKNQQIFTEVLPYTNFYLAEERHQKYKLQRQPELFSAFRQMYPTFPDIVHSTAAARVNGYLYTCTDCHKLQKELGSFGLSDRAQKILLDTVTTANGLSCGKLLRKNPTT